MFGLAAGLYNSYLAPTRLSVLLVGIDGSGKTALLERCKVTRFDSSGRSASSSSRERFGHRQPPPVRWNSYSGRSTTAASVSEEVHPSPTNADGNDSGDVTTPLPAHPPSATPSKGLRKSQSEREGEYAAPAERRKRMGSSSSSRWHCPAPRSYRNAAVADDDEEQEDEVVDGEGGTTGSVVAASTAASGGPTLQQRRTASPSRAREAARSGGTATLLTKPPQNPPKTDVVEEVEHDLKRGARMFPLDKIRPTHGMNLAKNVDVCGCRCDFWDLAGSQSMRPLWERYYADADCIVFVVDAADTPRLQEARDALHRMREEEILAELRVPILVFANKSDAITRYSGSSVARSRSECEAGAVDPVDDGGTAIAGNGRGDFAGVMGSDELASFLGIRTGGADGSGAAGPIMVLFGGSAKTGEGVRAAFEWLVPKAKQLQEERQSLQ